MTVYCSVSYCTRYLKVSIHFDDTWNEEIVQCCKLRNSSCRQSNLDSDSCSSPGLRRNKIYHCVVALGWTSYVGVQYRRDTCSFIAILHLWHVGVNGCQNRACWLTKRDPQKSHRYSHTTSSWEMLRHWQSLPQKVDEPMSHSPWLLPMWFLWWRLQLRPRHAANILGNARRCQGTRSCYLGDLGKWLELDGWSHNLLMFQDPIAQKYSYGGSYVLYCLVIHTYYRE